MNKLLKYILIGIAIASVSVASVKADNLPSSGRGGNNIQTDGSYSYSTQRINITTTKNFTVNDYDFTCFHKSTQDASCVYSQDGGTNRVLTSLTSLSCVNTSTFTIKGNCGDTYFFYFKVGQGIIPNITMSSLECQTEYSLIPISEVTANYCKLNFDLIDPASCPINSGTGAIVRSNLMINDVPYAQNQNINVFIPDFLAWNISFNDLYTVIEVEGYDADTEYIENVINNEKITPTNEDFTNMLTGLANLFPYLAIAFLMYWLIRLVYKSFK